MKSFNARDGNNVISDVEMAELAKNTIKYNTFIAHDEESARN